MDKPLTKHNKALQAMANKRRAKVAAMRKKKVTWAEIGEKLGVSRQRAQQLGRDT